MTDETNSPAPTKVPKGRSPNYPGISLSTAIDRARVIYTFAETHPVPLTTITSKWGYKTPTTGPASVTYAALKKFGLMEDEGNGNDRMGHLTDLAVEILNPNPNQDQAIKKAALTPAIMREWWGKYSKGLPPEETLRWEYVIKGPFTENGFKDFLRVFQDTASFAKLDASVTLAEETPDPEDEDGDEERGEEDAPPGSQNHKPRLRNPLPEGAMSYAIPVARSENVTLEGEFPLTEAKWDRLMNVLNAMKPSLVIDPDEEE